jgi:hypothetical protein
VTYLPQSFRSFGGGLNLRDKADVVEESQAIDCLNVLFTERGSVRSRDGYGTFASGLTNAVDTIAPFYRSGATAQLLAGCGTRIEALDNAGAVVASNTGLTTGTWSFARFGDPNQERTYAGQGDNLLQRWTGAAWSAVASSPKAGALAVEAVSNRLVAGRFNGTAGGPTGGALTSSPSHVYFSNAGDPETWGTNNYIQVTPGDGEKVQAIVAWREFVFIFKETKFAVVYGEDTDGAGQPVFRYRMVDAGIGLASPRAVAIAEEGVYFMDRKGVYRTDGGEPQRVSSLIDPVWGLGSAEDFYLGGVIAHSAITNCAMAVHDRKIYLSFPTSSTADRTLVYDPRYEWWSIYDLPAACLTSFRPSTGQAELFFGHSNGVARHSPSYADDAGTDITSRWRSGWFDYGLSDQKTIRESKVWGKGATYLAISNDFKPSPDSNTL